MTQAIKEENWINNTLCLIPKTTTGLLEMVDVQRAIEQQDHRFSTTHTLVQDFVAAVKQDCVVAKFFFNFYYIPDLIMRQKYTRPQY